MKKKEKVARPGGLELPTFWFVAIGVKMLIALFGVAYESETPFFPHLAAPNLAPKTGQSPILARFRWQPHCRALYQTPVAAWFLKDSRSLRYSANLCKNLE
jgi:hypothetical protein